MYPFKYSSLAQLADDRAKQLSVVLGREVAKIRSLEAECIEVNKATIFSGVSMTVNLQHAQIEYSSLAQLAERMTVNHDVAGSSPAGGAILIGQKCNLCQKALFYKAFSVF